MCHGFFHKNNNFSNMWSFSLIDKGAIVFLLSNEIENYKKSCSFFDWEKNRNFIIKKVLKIHQAVFNQL